MNDLRPRSAMPLTWRLAIGYTLGAAVTLVTLATFLQHSLRQRLEAEHTRQMEDCVASVRAAVAPHPSDLHELEEMVESGGEHPLSGTYSLRIIEENGNPVLTSAGMENLGLAAAAFPPAAPGPMPAPVAARSLAGADLRLAAVRLERGPKLPPLVCQLAVDVSLTESWLDGFRRTLTLMIAVATALSAGIGWAITRAGLAPLRHITASIRQVTACGLGSRISDRIWPTELAALAVEFDHMLARLRASFEQLSQFTADAAHEFRTPLNNLMGATSLLLSRERSPAEYRDGLAANLEEYGRLNRMIESLLFLARAETTTAADARPLAAAACLAEVMDIFSALAEQRGVALRGTGDAVIHADPMLLRMALTNLISNALRHTPHGGAITVDLAATPAGGGRIRVRDTGTGIAPPDLPRIFDRFYRADRSRLQTDDTGAGLGLALVQTIMKLHAGTVTATSIPGQGAEFQLDFPPAAPH